MSGKLLVIVAAVLVAGCSKAPNSGQLMHTIDVGTAPIVAPPPIVSLAGESSDASRPGASRLGGGAGAGSIRTDVVAPSIAYTYGFSFRMPVDRIAALQADDVRLCDALGDRCHIVSMSQVTGDAVGSGDVVFAVAAESARRFGDALASAVGHANGTVAGRTIEGEDLSKQIVDVEARLRGRQALADRLLDIVKTHSGTIAELTQAENSLASVQEEIDTARSELAAARERVAMSTVRVRFQGDARIQAFSSPVGASLSKAARVAGVSLALLISLLAALLPWAVPAAAGLAAYRWWTIRRRPKPLGEMPEPSQE